MINQEKINNIYKNYFINNDDNLSSLLTYSGPLLAKKVNDNETVLDVGCGRNPFKSLIKNLTGIDPVTDQADYKVSLQDFTTTETFDVIFCLGSVMYGDYEDIKHQISKLCLLLKPNGRIYWRCAVGLADRHPDIGFNWTEELHHSLASEFGFELVDLQTEYSAAVEPEFKKLYAEWRRL